MDVCLNSEKWAPEHVQVVHYAFVRGVQGFRSIDERYKIICTSWIGFHCVTLENIFSLPEALNMQLCNKNTRVSSIKMDVKHYNLILYLIVGSGSFEMETLQGGNQICIKAKQSYGWRYEAKAFAIYFILQHSQRNLLHDLCGRRRTLTVTERNAGNVWKFRWIPFPKLTK